MFSQRSAIKFDNNGRIESKMSINNTSVPISPDKLNLEQTGGKG